MPIVRVPLYSRQGLGLFAIIDAEDAERIAGYRWRAERGKHTVYAVANVERGSRKTVKLHRLILDAPSGVEVDHVNRQGLDCRRQNLRLATHQDNQRNRAKQLGNSSRYKGVGWHKATRSWRARIKVDNRTEELGGFSDEEAAARAYDRRARVAFGEFAVLNFPCVQPSEALPTDPVRAKGQIADAEDDHV